MCAHDTFVHASLQIVPLDSAKVVLYDCVRINRNMDTECNSCVLMPTIHVLFRMHTSIHVIAYILCVWSLHLS